MESHENSVTTLQKVHYSMNVIRIVTIAAFAASILSLFASSMTFADHSTDKGEIKKFTSDGYFVTNILKVEINELFNLQQLRIWIG